MRVNVGLTGIFQLTIYESRKKNIDSPAFEVMLKLFLILVYTVQMRILRIPCFYTSPLFRCARYVIIRVTVSLWQRVHRTQLLKPSVLLFSDLIGILSRAVRCAWHRSNYVCTSYAIKYTNIPDDLMVVELFARTIMDGSRRSVFSNNVSGHPTITLSFIQSSVCSVC